MMSQRFFFNICLPPELGRTFCLFLNGTLVARFSMVTVSFRKSSVSPSETGGVLNLFVVSNKYSYYTLGITMPV